MTVEALKERIRSFCAFASENYTARNCNHPTFPEEAELAAALDPFPALEAKEREAVRATLTDQFDASELVTFAVRCGSFAVQRNDMKHLRFGLLALLVDADALDPRDVVRSLGVLNAAAARLNVDLFRGIAALLLESATPARRKLIEDFFLHPDGVRNLKSLGYELANVDGALWFRSCVA